MQSYNEIPLRKVRKAGIDENLQYSLKSKVKINNNVPEYFILSENNKVEFIAQGDINSLINKLFENYKNIVSLNNVSNSIINNFSKDYFKYNKNKKTILFFSTNDCEACTKVHIDIINSKVTSAKFNIITVSQGNDDKFSVNILDEYNLYSNLYNVKQFPCLLILNDKSQIERIITNIDSILLFIKNQR